MDTWVQDLRYAVRMLWKSPGFSLVSIVALALGIGANSTVYSTLAAMVLRPLPFRNLDRMVTVSETLPRQGQDGISMAPANYRDLGERNTVFEGMTAFRGRGWDANLTGIGAPERLEGYEVTSTFFSLLGMAPALGRTFTEQDAESRGARVVVISYATWQRHLGADAKVIGRTLALNGGDATVVGVMPAEFDFPIGSDIWSPFAMNTPEMSSRGNHELEVLGRLKPGVSMEQAAAEASTIAGSLEKQYPATNEGRGLHVSLLRKVIGGETREYVKILMWAAVFVLLLACANVANLQLARATARQKEVALRAALGATRWRIARQVLVESSVVSVAGGAVGLVMSAWGIAVTRSAVPPFIVQHIACIKNIRLDGGVVAFTAVVAVLTGIVAGLVPAIHAAVSANLNEALKEGSHGSSTARERGRLRSLLVVTEVALALVLLVGAGLMVKGFRVLLSRDAGFESQTVLSMRVTLPDKQYASARQRADFYDQAVQRLAALPGVQAAAAMKFLPNGWSWQTGSFVIEKQAAAPGQVLRAGVQPVTPDFARTLRIPLVRGRTLAASDGAEAPYVTVISSTMARRYWPGGDAIGHRVRFASGEPWRTIVGVVGDIRQNVFDDSYRSTAYVPMAQTAPQTAGFVVRTAGDPMAVAAAARAAISSVDPNQPVYDLRALRQLIADNASGVEYSANMMMAFGTIALLLAAAGIYAVMAYAVVQRTHEIGIRMALGAQTKDVLRLIVGNSMTMCGVGLAVGVPMALAVAKLLNSVLMAVALDPVVFVGLTAVLAGVALAAGYVPARRATRVDPMVALRNE